MKATIFIPGQTPSKKNSKQIILPGDGRRRIISSEFHAAWEKEALRRLREHELVGHQWRYPLRASFHYLRKGRHRFDWNNLDQAAQDILVKAGIIKDDSMIHLVPNGELSWEVNKDCQGVYVTLEEIEEVNGNAHPGTKSVFRSGAVSPQKTPQDPGQGQEGAAALEEPAQGDEYLPVPILSGRLVTGKPVHRTVRTKPGKAK